MAAALPRCHPRCRGTLPSLPLAGSADAAGSAATARDPPRMPGGDAEVTSGAGEVFGGGIPINQSLLRVLGAFLARLGGRQRGSA